ncbi:MAG: hypothetical protein ACN4GZ_09665 [Acidimicrobiales bacterium]
MNEPHFTPPATAHLGTPEMLLGSTEESVTTSSTVNTSGVPGRLAVGGLVAALAVGGLFATRAALTEPAGPASSEEAVTEFFAALDNDDFVGLAEVIHPAERESLAQPVFDMVDHAKRLEVVSASTDLTQSSFIDFQVEGVTFSVESTSPKLHYVTTTGGTISAPENPTLPTGPLFDRFDIDVMDSGGGTVTADLGIEPMQMAVIEEDGSWYVSIWYSVAESARREAGLAFPGVGTGPAPVGSATPDGVMEDMMAAIFDLDADRVLTLLDPEEAAALYDYSPLFMNDLRVALAEVEAEAAAAGMEWSLDSIDFTATEANGRQLVSFNSMTASFSIESEWTSMSGSIRIDDDCSIVTVDEETLNSCDVQSGEQRAELDRLRDELLEVADLSAVTLNAFEKVAAVERGITVVERDGRWYLSLMPTMLETVNDHMAVLDAGDLVAVGTDIEELVEDQDRVGEELFELLLTVDTDAMGADLGSMGLGSLLGTSSSDQFIPIAPVVDDPVVSAPVTDDSDWSVFDLGDIESVLVPHDSAFSVGIDETYLSWELEMDAAPDYVGGAYVFGDFESIEVTEFASPVDPGLLDSSTWSLAERDGVTIATNVNFGEQFAFVGNYVVWSFDGGSDDGLFASQVAALK